MAYWPEPKWLGDKTGESLARKPVLLMYINCLCQVRRQPVNR
jgi:hypothetical protein